MTRKAFVILIACAPFVLTSCISNDTKTSKKDKQTQTKGTGMKTTSSGLQYETKKEGSGQEAIAGQKVTVHYTGWLHVDGAKGAKFDSSRDRGTPFSFPLGARRVIAGWDEGVAGMKPGEVRELVIPAHLGYGNRAVGSIPAGSTLLFEVELISAQ